MFTGLIETTGKILNIQKTDSGKVFEISAKDLLPEIQVDDSVAVNGVCLTATSLLQESFLVTAVHLTLEKTNLHTLNVGDEVNLELALKFSDRLGGHLVQGHVGGIALLKTMTKKGDNYEIEFEIPQDQMKYIIKEGSIALDGISLTVADIHENKILVTVIPHTWSKTQLKNRKIGDKINFEVDLMAKYLENFLKIQRNGGQNEISFNS